MALSYLSLLLLALAAYSSAIPSPGFIPTSVPGVIPELIPGPGLPSLASLNLTTEELYNKAVARLAGENDTKRDDLSALYDNHCDPSVNSFANLTHVLTCYEYLNSLDYNCETDQARSIWSTYCIIGEAKVVGLTKVDGKKQVDTCKSVAYAVKWVVDHCRGLIDFNGGWAAAYGNGNHEVGTLSIYV